MASIKGAKGSDTRIAPGATLFVAHSVSLSNLSPIERADATPFDNEPTSLRGSIQQPWMQMILKEEVDSRLEMKSEYREIGNDDQKQK
jgi:hypothetical protein